MRWPVVVGKRLQEMNVKSSNVFFYVHSKPAKLRNFQPSIELSICCTFDLWRMENADRIISIPYSIVAAISSIFDQPLIFQHLVSCWHLLKFAKRRFPAISLNSWILNTSITRCNLFIRGNASDVFKLCVEQQRRAKILKHLNENSISSDELVVLGRILCSEN